MPTLPAQSPRWPHKQVFAAQGRVAMCVRPDAEVPVALAIGGWHTPGTTADLADLAAVVAEVMARLNREAS